MRKEGLEPSPQRDMILSHARLPIPPLPHKRNGTCHVKGRRRIIDRRLQAYKGRNSLQFDAGDIRDVAAINLIQYTVDDQLSEAEQRLHLRDSIQVETRQNFLLGG